MPTAPRPLLPRVVVLCDAAAATGLGHAVRCSALAERLSAGGTDVHLLLPEDSLPHVVTAVRRNGWTVTIGPWEARAVSDLAGPAGVTVVDSYRVDGAWLTDLHARGAAAGARLAVIDDQADRTFSADLVLNQNLGAERFEYPRAGRVLAGPRYALLRPEFPAHRVAALAGVDRLPDLPRRVLVLFGGTDVTGMAGIAADAASLAFPDAEVRAVVPTGHGAPRAGVTYLPHTDAIHEEMLAADLVVSAGGSTLWELCCLARPTAVIAVAANQRPAYDELREQGAILPAGREPVRDMGELAARLRRLVEPAGTLRTVARRAAQVTDGQGCARVARALGEPGAGGVSVRPATHHDEALLLTWRNDPAVRSQSRSTDPVAPDTHAAWLRTSVATPDRHLLVVETAADTANGRTPAATTRYDLLPGEARSRARWEVSITVAPEMRGRGLGSNALKASDVWLLTTEPQASEIVAWVRTVNAPSHRLFEHNGYRRVASAEPDLDCYIRRRTP